jgi:hypothetical protein
MGGEDKTNSGNCQAKKYWGVKTRNIQAWRKSAKSVSCLNQERQLLITVNINL